MNFTVNAFFCRFFALFLGSALFFLPAARAETWRIALIGDTPYSSFERAELPNMLAAIADHGSQLILHAGDIKHGGARCDDALYADRFALFDASRVPFILVPGDNDWTDCQRLSNGGYAPEERLEKLRDVFWRSGESLGQSRLRLTQQSPQRPEHARFRLGPVLFVTLNVPGGNNHWGLTTTPGEEFSQRLPQLLAWLSEGFALAREEKLAGIALIFQANPGFKDFARGMPHAGYKALLERLRDETGQFPGQVLVVHGDTHWSRVDQPLRAADGSILTNFTRVETHGYPWLGWTLGIIDPADPALWRFEPKRWPPPER